MKLLFVVDGRSPIALNWIRYFAGMGDEVHLVSLFHCQPALQLTSLHILPVAFSRAAELGGQAGSGSALKRLAPPGLRTRLRQLFVPRSLPKAAASLDEIIRSIQPDLVHAMRIPYEGMLAAQAVPPGLPLLVSVWGNDFTLHAASSPTLGKLTRQTLARASALHCDCRRDLRLAQVWGYAEEKPGIVLPGGGGIDLAVFHPAEPELETSQPLTLINPRGLRAYVRSDTFFQALPAVLRRYPQARILCPAMLGEAEAERWLQKLNLSGNVTLLPHLNRLEMADAFRKSQIALSISTHDGTPNTLLEAMASGCFPVAGDIEPLREWIASGENGLLVNPADPAALAQAILQAAGASDLRARARLFNLGLVRERAEYRQVMEQARQFYGQIAGRL